VTVCCELQAVDVAQWRQEQETDLHPVEALLLLEEV
jgi:hypothetical protein